ncbi:MAG: phosphoribosylglycinamide formyltransferase [Gammaproteobacteria bacterium]|nr:phosphoribosylglycinamide formyltransferase [Gammaproteobacteria bacterium]HBX00332.1 phosphoribosylglycinamide formyltransferase [Gammaproteobacteria bacterium]
MMRLAVLASHEGSTLQALIDACAAQTLEAEVVLVVSNNSKAGALRRAVAANIDTRHISIKTHGSEAAANQAIADALSDTKADWVLLLGYMKKMGEAILRQFSGRIINTHPALLPDFGGQGFFGRKVHEAVHAAGVNETGATLHIVGQDYDTGPIIAQIRVPVLSGDDIDAIELRVKTAERKLLVDTLSQIEADGLNSL